MAKLTFLFSSMNSGKSLLILTRNYTLKQKGFSTILMKPATDDRTDTISSRLGISADCVVLAKDELPSHKILISGTGKPDFVMVDEAQFLTKTQVWDLANLCDNWDINIYCYGLKLDWQGNFFEGSEHLFKIADELIPIENFCRQNHGAQAFFHIKRGGTDASVETGYEDLYDTVSRKIWKRWWDTRT